jgi:hypothetical protein
MLQLLPHQPQICGMLAGTFYRWNHARCRVREAGAARAQMAPITQFVQAEVAARRHRRQPATWRRLSRQPLATRAPHWLAQNHPTDVQTGNDNAGGLCAERTWLSHRRWPPQSASPVVIDTWFNAYAGRSRLVLGKVISANQSDAPTGLWPRCRMRRALQNEQRGNERTASSAKHLREIPAPAL